MFIILVLTLLGVSSSLNANAQSGITNDDPPITEDALLFDAKWYADDMNVSVEEAYKRLSLQKPFGIINEQLLNNEAETFAGAYIQHEPGYRFIARFTGDFKGDIQTYLFDDSLTQYVEVDTTAQYSLAELKEAQLIMIDKLDALEIKFETGIKVRANAVELYVTDIDALNESLDSRSETLSPVINIIELEQFSTEEANVYAGLELVPCTSGFSVRHSDGTLGILTAAHCTPDPPDAPIYFEGIELILRQWNYGGPHDVQWRTTPGFTVRNLMFDGTYNRYVRGIKLRDQQVEEEYVCKHGKITEYTCGFIDHKNHRPPPDNGATFSATFIYVRSAGENLSEVGDSGAPWFSGNTAYGVHRSGLGDDATYMAIDYITVLDVDVLVTTDLNNHPVADFDGSEDTDISVFRPSNGNWYIMGQGSTSWGVAGDIPVPGNYAGDGDYGNADIAFYRPSNGKWYIHGKDPINFGISGDVPMQCDYDGDDVDNIAVYRPSNGNWYIMGQGFTPWGLAGDIPVPADYDGDGDCDIAVYRPSNGNWYIMGQSFITWGLAGDIPIPGDYDGDGDADIAVYRPSNQNWYIKDHQVSPIKWGYANDIPVPGDYDGDGSLDIAVLRPSNGKWYIMGQSPISWFVAGDYPLPVRDTNADGDVYH